MLRLFTSIVREIVDEIVLKVNVAMSLKVIAQVERCVKQVHLPELQYLTKAEIQMGNSPKRQ